MTSISPRLVGALSAALLLVACNTDPYSTRPETGARLPVPPVAEAPETEPETESEAQPDTPDQAPEPIEAPEPAPVPEPEPEPAPQPEPEPETPATAPTPTLPASPSPVRSADTIPRSPDGPYIDHTSTDPIPYSSRLVRGIRNNGTITLTPGQTVTLALNANREIGYEWALSGEFEPGGALEFIADYYRDGQSPFPDRAAIGGARYFILQANAPGTYLLAIRHQGATDVRATKNVTLQVTAPE